MATLSATDRNWQAVTLIASGTVVTVPAGQTVAVTPVRIPLPTGVNRVRLHCCLTKSATIAIADDTLNLTGALSDSTLAPTYRTEATDTSAVDLLTAFDGGTTVRLICDVAPHPYMGLSFVNGSGSSRTWTADEDVVIVFPRQS